ncbi:PAS and ANTAR domain-containing protein [Nocardia sp. NBC_00508]|uniref:PAS and ANTAR domain-containing protein n=1 Tax=Nocardia sp. NBC_00508 TaxID=2975992 RepID=UPI002E81B254|nr:PAS and ANTAR domain-containing protein [Nocardia sp. NBC_00508]WUD70064.1 PAS and ANTAR domain-containing protein [Nocardia sp. NBC_00508]
MDHRAPTSASAVESVVAGTPQSVGSFRFWFEDQRWEWSDEAAAVYGYAAESTQPSTELLLAHKHPDDRALVARSIDAAVRTGEPFCGRHRVIDTSGRVHHVIVVADRMFDDRGLVVGTTGYLIDVSDALEENRQEILDDTLPELVESRAVIEQAKGVLMVVYGINAEQAFRVLQWRSQETNVKLRTLAHQLVNEIPAMGGGPASQRARFDHLLLTMRGDVVAAE